MYSSCHVARYTACFVDHVHYSKCLSMNASLPVLQLLCQGAFQRILP
jgi:hypothetical protein